MQAFDHFDARLHHARNGKPIDSRKVANNTYLHRIDADTIGLRLHSTDVVTYHRDGTVTLDSGGWQTVTTKDRMHYFSPVDVRADRGSWYVSLPNPLHTYESGEERYLWTVPYWDGMTIDETTRTAPTLPESEEVKDAADKLTLKLISGYLRGLHSL